MNKLLVVVDMQNDFIDGSLGTSEAVSIIPNVVEKIKNWDGSIITTLDTHKANYLETREGKNLPVEHCIEDTQGRKINPEVFKALCSNHDANTSFLTKRTFGSTALPEIIRGEDIEYIELIGLCTDVCVISNALLLKANYPETHIAVDASCCAGITPESHRAALLTMKMCQIDIIDESSQNN